MRSMAAWPRWEEPLSTTQNTRLALAYGSTLMTCSTRRANGAMPVVGSQRPNTLPRWTSQDRWPALNAVQVRYRGVFAYMDRQLPGGVTLPLCRLRYNGSAGFWGFAIYLASQDGYEDNVLPSVLPSGSPEEALDCACGLYLNDPTAWLQPPTN